jgi:hypothetical protein
VRHGQWRESTATAAGPLPKRSTADSPPGGRGDNVAVTDSRTHSLFGSRVRRLRTKSAHSWTEKPLQELRVRPLLQRLEESPCILYESAHTARPSCTQSWGSTHPGYSGSPVPVLGSTWPPPWAAWEAVPVPLAPSGSHRPRTCPQVASPARSRATGRLTRRRLRRLRRVRRWRARWTTSFRERRAWSMERGERREGEKRGGGRRARSG